MRSDLIARCGSRLYGLEQEKSDYDYLHLVSGNNASKYDKEVCYQDNDTSTTVLDNFLIRTDSFYSINSCAGPLIIHLYDQTDNGESMILRNFWRVHNKELAEIALYTSYLATFHEVESDIAHDRVGKFAVCARMLGLMDCRYYTNHIFEARKLSPKWISRYWKAKGERVTLDEIKSWVDEVKTPSIQEFYRNQPVNTHLHDEYKKVLDKVLADSPIT